MEQIDDVQQNSSTNINIDILLPKDQSYKDLINYCSLRKQFSRIIPIYYMDYQKYDFITKQKHVSSIEEYEKLKHEIISLKESINILKSKKQKKIKEIEELRSLMGKIGNKKTINASYVNNMDPKELLIQTNQPIFN